MMMEVFLNARKMKKLYTENFLILKVRQFVM